MNYSSSSYIPYYKSDHTAANDEIYVFSTLRTNFGLILEYSANNLIEQYNKNFFDAFSYSPSEAEFFCRMLSENKNTPIFTVGGKKHRLVIAFHNMPAPICIAVVLCAPVEYACKGAVDFFQNSFLSDEVYKKAQKRKNDDFEVVSQISNKLFTFNNFLLRDDNNEMPSPDFVEMKIKHIARALCPDTKLNISHTIYQYDSERSLPTVFDEGCLLFFLICAFLTANRYAKRNEISVELFEENRIFGINLSFDTINGTELPYMPIIEKLAHELNLIFTYTRTTGKLTARAIPFCTDIGLIGLKAPVWNLTGTDNGCVK